MPVIFKCSCGEYLSVPNKYIGKKLQCPQCQSIVAVPVPGEEAEERPSEKREF